MIDVSMTLQLVRNALGSCCWSGSAALRRSLNGGECSPANVLLSVGRRVVVKFGPLDSTTGVQSKFNTDACVCDCSVHIKSVSAGETVVECAGMNLLALALGKLKSFARDLRSDIFSDEEPLNLFSSCSKYWKTFIYFSIYWLFFCFCMFLCPFIPCSQGDPQPDPGILGWIWGISGLHLERNRQ